MAGYNGNDGETWGEMIAKHPRSAMNPNYNGSVKNTSLKRSKTRPNIKGTNVPIKPADETKDIEKVAQEGLMDVISLGFMAGAGGLLIGGLGGLK